MLLTLYGSVDAIIVVPAHFKLRFNSLSSAFYCLTLRATKNSHLRNILKRLRWEASFHLCVDVINVMEMLPAQKSTVWLLFVSFICSHTKHNLPFPHKHTHKLAHASRRQSDRW